MMTNVTFNQWEHPIGGKLVVGTTRINETYLMNTNWEAKLKQDLVEHLVNYILEQKLVEFTKVRDPVSLDEIIRVRAYLAPDDQVKILRTTQAL